MDIVSIGTLLKDLGVPVGMLVVGVLGVWRVCSYLGNWAFRAPDKSKEDKGGYLTRFFEETLETNELNRESNRKLSDNYEKQTELLEKQTELHQSHQATLQSIEKVTSSICRFNPALCYDLYHKNHVGDPPKEPPHARKPS